MQDQPDRAAPPQDGQQDNPQPAQEQPRYHKNRNTGPIQKTHTKPKTAPRNPSCMRPCPAELSSPQTHEPTFSGPPRFSGRHVQKPRRPVTEHEPPKHQDGRSIRQPFNGEAHLYEVIQVRLSRTQRLVEVNTNGLRLGPNTPVLIRVHRNILLATTFGYRHRRVAEINSLPFIIRVASDEDKQIDAENARIEKHAQELASSYAIAQNLQMKVLSADLSHDHKNITINFASDVRVDFREMVAYLSGQLKLRVEMYQLGLRNGTGLICGLGACGQLLCCGRFLGQFDPIAVKQLRAQGLATNPKRISGVCGRLYCCMSYEYCDYMKERRALPKKGKRVFTQWGIGRVTDIDMLREEVVITYENGESQRLTPHDYVNATEEIIAKVEAEDIEFPIEPAKFYLNHDPSAAAQETSRTKPPVRPPTTMHVRRIDPTNAIRKQVAQPAAKSEPVANPAEKPAKRRKLPKTAEARPADAKPVEAALKAVPAKRPARAHAKVKTDPAKQKIRQEQSRRQARQEQGRPLPQASGGVPVKQPEPARQIAEPALPSPGDPHVRQAEPSHVSRVPRMVKARQANLEESLNAEQRIDPGKPSRRRYTPVQPGAQPNPAPDK